MPEIITFYLFAALTVVASLLVIAQRNPMYSVMLLIVSFGGLSGLYIQLEAPFVAVAQIIIYAGAIMVLFLFVVMLLNAPKEDAADWDRSHPLRQPGVARWGTLLAALLIVQLASALMAVSEYKTPVGAQSDATTVNKVADMGRSIFTRHTFAFEATSILILVAMVGAVVLARREE
jgi:NADH-quinone oxidoreductase subunit J